MSGKYSQRCLDHHKKFAPDAIKTAFKKAIQKTVEATGVLIGNKFANKVTKSLKKFTASKVYIEDDKEMPKEIYVSQKRQQIINALI